MENLYNRFVFTHWKHNNGFEHRWLRRINRQTKTQYISDCQRYLISGDEKYMKGIFHSCATRFFFDKNGSFNQIRGRKYNTDGIHTVKLLEDFNILNASISFDDLKKYCSELESVYIVKSDADYVQKIVTHLKNIFGNIEILYLMDVFGNVNTTHITEPITNSAIHYHITIFGENKKIISSKEDKNSTICFWKFENTIVFMLVSGIGTW